MNKKKIILGLQFYLEEEITWNPFLLKQSKLKGRYEQNKGHWTHLDKFANEFQRLQEVLHVFDLLIVTNS